PIKFENYIWSKAFSLTILALPICFGIVFSAHGFSFNYFAFISAVLFSSLLFALLGFIGVARVQTFNQYIIIIPLFFAPAIIPLLDLFDLWFHPLLYLIPTQASLLLFRASFEPISFFEWTYAISYLTIWLAAARYFAVKAYKKHLLIN
ncbi:MAG: ABC transporter permease, partial [Chloroflexia bacterium]|nr:ABC transporter permease [Chloroflexia bacterium]